MSATTGSFVFEFPLQANPEEERELNIRFNASRQLYNACLGESLRQISLIRQSRQWNEASRLKKQKDNTAKRRKLYKEAEKEYDFSEYSLHTFVGKLRNNCWIRKHIDSLSAQKLATQAFSSLKQYLIGKRGRPRFRAYNRFRSVEGKNNISGIRWKNDRIIWAIRGGKALSLIPLFDPKDPHHIQAHALECRTKYVRLVRKNLRGRERWYAQLVQEGKPLLKEKNKVGEGIVGLDVGPSTIAVASSSEAILKPFCAKLQVNNLEIKSFQRRMSRSRKLTNPSNFNDDGTIKKIKYWIRSKRYQKLKKAFSEQQRILAATRKRLHGELVNEILSLGKNIKTEKLSYKSFQKNFGRSVGFRAPGMFLSLLRRKAESAGGRVEEFSTFLTKLSQVCHCKREQKKALSERWHQCSCGVTAQRDLYSAFLAQFVENNRLDTNQAQKAWPAAEPLLERAVLRLNEQATGKLRFSSFGLNQRQSRSHAKGKSLLGEAVDAVSFLLRATESPVTCS